MNSKVFWKYILTRTRASVPHLLNIILILFVSILPAKDLEIAPEKLPTTIVFPPYLHSYGIRKATNGKLKMFLGPFAAFKDPQGLCAVRMTSRDDPATEDDDDEVVVYGVNSGRHQIIYNTSMYGIASFGSKGSGRGQFLNPKGVAADIHGNVYIADAGNDRIVHLFNPKKEVTWRGAFGRSGTGKGQLKSPEGVALDSKGRIYVTDTGNDRIQIFHAKGICEKIIGSGILKRPTQLAVCDRGTKWSNYRTNVIFVIDRNRRRIQKLDFNGKVLALIENWPDASVRYEYICLDFYNQVYVTDKTNSRVLKLDRFLKPLTVFGKKGSGDQEFIEPRGITVWQRYGQMFVAEKGGAQYYWTGTDARDVKVEKDGKGYRLTFFAMEPSFFTLMVPSEKDTVVVWKKRRVRSGENRFHFRLPPRQSKKDKILIRLEPRYSSYTYFAKEWVRKLPK